MGLVFADGFDSYAASLDLGRNWTGSVPSWTWNSSAGRNGGGAITDTAGSKTLAMPRNLATLGTGQAWRLWILAQGVGCTDRATERPCFSMEHA